MLSFRSRAAMWELMVGWVRYSDSAAREKLPRSTTATKASSSFMSISNGRCLLSPPGRTKTRRHVSRAAGSWREYVGIEPT